MSNVIPKLFKKGYRYPIYPTAEQKELLAKTFGCCRYVYNRALAESKLDYSNYLELKKLNSKALKPKVSGYDLANRLSTYKANPASSWLSEVSSVALQQSLLHLGSAYSSFFKRGGKGFPSFKKRYHKQSFSLMTTSFQVKDNQLFIAKCKEAVPIDWTRELPNYPSSATITKTPTGKYFIVFICEYTPTKTAGAGKIGLDLGIKDFLTTSDGIKIANPKHLYTYQKRLRRAQQALSKKTKDSKNYQKAKLKVAKIHELIRNLRSNFQHQLSRQLINDNQVIGIETLKVANMVRNRKLSKSIADASWSSFIAKLIYKAQESQHCDIVKIDSFYPSSHICNRTQKKLEYKLKLSERIWKCPYCGDTHDRDINAAINIRDEALRVQAIYASDGGAGKLILATRH